MQSDCRGLSPLHPYVVAVRERKIDGIAVHSWILVGGQIRGELEFLSEKDAVEAANTLRCEKEIRAAAGGALSAAAQINRSFGRILAHNQREWSRFSAQRLGR